MLKTPLSTVLGGALWIPRATILGSTSKTFSQIIQFLFANGEQGFVYDPNDLSTMFQDAAGTVPVTGAGQPVGLMLDKSKGLVLSANIVTNSNFTSLDGWTSGTYVQAVLVQAGVQISSPTSPTNGSIHASFANQFSWYLPTQLGKRFKITFDAKHVSGMGVLQVGSSFSVGLQINPNENGGVLKRYTTQVTGSLGGYATTATFGATNGSVWVISNVVSQEVIGNHAYQTTSASRPILRQNATTGAYYLEFDGSDDFLQTGNTDFTSTFEMSLFVGIKKMSDSSRAMAVELGNNQPNSIKFAAPDTPTPTYAVYSQANLGVSVATPFEYPAPITNVVTAKAKLSTGSLVLRVDGVVKNQIANVDQGAGKFGNHPLYIGRRGGTSLPFNGHIYGIMGIGRLTIDSETTAIEKELAKRLGATLNV